jgi:hypothetical protein
MFIQVSEKVITANIQIRILNPENNILGQVLRKLSIDLLIDYITQSVNLYKVN